MTYPHTACWIKAKAAYGTEELARTYETRPVGEEHPFHRVKIDASGVDVHGSTSA